MTTEIRRDKEIILSASDGSVIIGAEDRPDIIESGFALKLFDGRTAKIVSNPLPHVEYLSVGVARYGLPDSVTKNLIIAFREKVVVTEKEPEKPMTINGEKLTVQLIR